MPVAIIGMHRSGTSMVSRLANLAGLFIGDEADMLPATEYNRSGYWEPGWLCDLNDRILMEFGGTWHAPPLMPNGWERGLEFELLCAEGKSALQLHYSKREPWGWKDPRTTLLLPYWRSLIETPLKFVVCVRNPLDVAASVSRRDGIGLPLAMALWHYYTETALRETKPDERIVVFYEAFFEDYKKALDPVLAFAGLKMPAESSPVGKRMRGFIDADLKHHSHGLEDVLRHADIPEYSKAFYESLARAQKTLGPVWDGRTVAHTPPDQWQGLIDTLQREGRRQLCRENRTLHSEAWEMRRLNDILNSIPQALTVSAGRLLKRKSRQSRPTESPASDPSLSKPQQCATD